MKITYETEESKILDFEDLMVGEQFVYNGAIHIKVEHDVGDAFNCFNLSDCIIDWIEKDSIVKIIEITEVKVRKL